MIRLRALEREDLRQLRDWRNDPEIFSRVREYRFLNIENQEAWFDSLRDDRRTIMFGIVKDLTVELDPMESFLIGVCGLTGIDWVGRKGEISIYIGLAEQRGKGQGLKILDLLAAYAFRECNLQRLWAEVFVNNIPSLRLFAKAGFTEEGRLRSHAFKSGKYQDSILFGLLRNEWEKSVVLSA